MNVQTADTGEHVFVNRVEELGFLEGLVPPASERSSLVILRSPTGYGKSSMTDEFVRRCGPELAAIVVDPLIRASPRGVQMYDGFFIQRCAAEFSSRAKERDRATETFDGFLSRQRRQLVSRKNLLRDLREMPGAKLGYALAIEYAERFFARGRFSPATLLKSDAREAVAFCRDYVEYACTLGPTVIVIREGQHLDHESLRTLLQLNRRCAGQHMIIEYTTVAGDFEPDHAKILLRELDAHPNVHLHELKALPRPEFELLLSQIGFDGRRLNAEYFGSWNGNLRTIAEMRFQVGFARPLGQPVDLAATAPDLGRQIREHLGCLTSSQRWLIAIVAAHVEPIERRTLFSTALSRERHVTATCLDDDLSSLVEDHRLLDLRRDQVSLANDDVAKGIDAMAAMQGLAALGEAALRDHYAELVRERDFTVVSMAIAARRLFAFCARTREVAAMLRVIETIDDQVRHANDQTIYVDMVAEAIGEAADLLPSERRRLVTWAAFMAYEINDFRRTIELLETLAGKGIVERAVLAHSLVECGSHAPAEAIAGEIRALPDTEAGLLADLILGGIALDAGRTADCADILRGVVAAGADARSPLVGHAYRLLSEVEEYPACTATALRSVDWFRSCGLGRCAAYSALSASRFLARTGRIEEAMALVDAAQAHLRHSIRNQHLVLNDRALVGLLSASPDYQRCGEWLGHALRTSRDDFSDLTILTNLAIANWKRGALADALECVRRCASILDDPGFAEREIYWGVCLNLAQVLRAAGDAPAADAMLDRPRRAAPARRTNARYWAYRYGEADVPDTALGYLLRFDYHPLALSHWQIDLEALRRGSRG